MLIGITSRRLRALGPGVAALAMVACHRPTPSGPDPGAGTPVLAPLAPGSAFSVDGLFTARTFQLAGKKVFTSYGEDGTSESEHHWLIACKQVPVVAPPPRRIAEVSCEAEPVPDPCGGSNGGPFDIDFDAYWVATPAGLWQVANVDDPLEPIAMMLSLPPVARHDEVPVVDDDDADGDPDDDQGARDVYETKQSPDGAWCHMELSDPGGGAEASYQSWCFDATGLITGTAGDGHGANTWESSFTLR